MKPAFLLTLALAACAPLAQMPPDAVQVDTALAVFDGSAATFAPRLAADLDAAVSRRIAGQSPVTVLINVRAMDVAGAASTALGRDRSTLVADVRIMRNGRTDGFTLRANAGDAASTPTTAVISAAITAPDAFYTDLIDRFAAGLAARLVSPDATADTAPAAAAAATGSAS